MKVRTSNMKKLNRNNLKINERNTFMGQCMCPTNCSCDCKKCSDKSVIMESKIKEIYK